MKGRISFTLRSPARRAPVRVETVGTPSAPVAADPQADSQALSPDAELAFDLLDAAAALGRAGVAVIFSHFPSAALASPAGTVNVVGPAGSTSIARPSIQACGRSVTSCSRRAAQAGRAASLHRPRVLRGSMVSLARPRRNARLCARCPASAAGGRERACDDSALARQPVEGQRNLDHAAARELAAPAGKRHGSRESGSYGLPARSR